jgi:hypothetical protein
MRTFRRRIATLSIAIGACGLAMALTAPTTLAHRAKTRVTIAPWSKGLLGTVQSNRSQCVPGRDVTVFRQLGDAQHPRRDKMIGTAVARRHNGVYEWALRRGTSGSFYAKARRRAGCRSRLSKTYAVVPRGDVPDCPTKDSPVCQFRLNFHSTEQDPPGFPGGCRFSDGTGLTQCTGENVNSTWPSESWVIWGRGDLWVQRRHRTDPGYLIHGIYPTPIDGYHVLQSVEAFYGSGAAAFKTADRAVPAGDEGGPLYLSTDSIDPGYRVTLRGYLYPWK